MKICRELQKNLLNLNNSFLFCAVVGLTLLCAGCAGHSRWGEPIDEQEQPEFTEILDSMVERDKSCPGTMIADLTLSYSSPLKKESVAGYLQFSLPTSYKFAITNPLGQVLWAVAGDNKSYQTIDAPHRQYTAGGMDALIIRNQLPLFLIQSPWGNWLMARNLYGGNRIIEIRKDPEQQGIWITIKTKSVNAPFDHLHIDPAKHLLLERIITDQDNDTLATISYNYTNSTAASDQCIQPAQIQVSGLNYGTTIDLQLSNIEFQPGNHDYTLPKPLGYYQQYLP